jgi:hypothetical protein
MASRAQAFREWAIGESLTTSGPVEQLKDKRLIIDAEDFLETILTSQASREPLLPALGGLPFALRKHVDTYISNFKEANITPTFVFNGLDLACKDRATIARDSRGLEPLQPQQSGRGSGGVWQILYANLLKLKRQ